MDWIESRDWARVMWCDWCQSATGTTRDEEHHDYGSHDRFYLCLINICWSSLIDWSIDWWWCVHTSYTVWLLTMTIFCKHIMHLCTCLTRGIDTRMDTLIALWWRIDASLTVDPRHTHTRLRLRATWSVLLFASKQVDPGQKQKMKKKKNYDVFFELFDDGVLRNWSSLDRSVYWLTNSSIDWLVIEAMLTQHWLFPVLVRLSSRLCETRTKTTKKNKNKIDWMMMIWWRVTAAHRWLFQSPHGQPWTPFATNVCLSPM